MTTLVIEALDTKRDEVVRLLAQMVVAQQLLAATTGCQEVGLEGITDLSIQDLKDDVTGTWIQVVGKLTEAGDGYEFAQAIVEDRLDHWNKQPAH